MSQAQKKSESFIIAEAGVNHNGRLELAQKLVVAAAEAGADAVKFQTFKAENLVTRNLAKAKYQQENVPGDNQYEMLKSLELSFEDFKVLKAYCDNVGIQFISTPFDEECADFLVRVLEMEVIKVPSGELTNLPFLHFLAAFQKSMILSTGMSHMEEVKSAVEVIKKSSFSQDLTLLHCTTEYPCSFEKVNLRAMLSLQREFSLPVGYSDHTAGIEVAIAAAALGATVIEKHFTLDQKMQGPDHKASLEPVALKQMVSAIRNVENSLGDGKKSPTEAELQISKLVRKTIVLRRSLTAGSVIQRDDLTSKRANGEIAPAQFERLIGCKLKTNKDKDEALFWHDLSE